MIAIENDSHRKIGIPSLSPRRVISLQATKPESFSITSMCYEYIRGIKSKLNVSPTEGVVHFRAPPKIQKLADEQLLFDDMPEYEA